MLWKLLLLTAADLRTCYDVCKVTDAFLFCSLLHSYKWQGVPLSLRFCPDGIRGNIFHFNEYKINEQNKVVC